ncbi:transcriptional regulator, TetR family [Cystobacter fuscus DSM 2262]|uniref:Transcriptional regulator, TetR family n=1 Tax=Cystobacter fuscus (strain ATCC 25194 / DSM 2262 / NBRC 100088 / M29) TaxID=1242864 RepID=S9QRM7_CYSF2|nr:TetR family transcriptional regulator [Cystobacter fuscus]EPX59273.1 transcriptional regulator, TetR family [Cystobacter fuscus DSM 2262]
MSLETKSPLTPAEMTKARILEAGMRCFAREGFAGATTRMIAAEAGVTLPVIAYHFGNKEGLHRACAQEIVEQHSRRLLPLVCAAREAANKGSLSATEARDWLDRILEALVNAVTADAEQRLTTDFVLREMSEQGPGYALLFEGLWSPGIGLVADLLAIARQRRPGKEEERAGAVMLITSLSAFTAIEPVSLAFLGWERLDGTRRDTVTALAKRLLDGLVGG